MVGFIYRSCSNKMKPFLLQHEGNLENQEQQLQKVKSDGAGRQKNIELTLEKEVTRKING